MRRFSAVTTTVLLSGAMLTAGATTAQASTHDDHDAHAAHAWHTWHAWRAHNHSRFGVHVLGALHLKSVNTTGDTHTGYLLCTVTTAGSGPATIHGTGPLKNPTSACEELAAVHGDLSKLAVHPNWMPPAIVSPVNVKAHGTWEGTKVAWSHVYTNDGWLTKATGDVFAF
jgi:hypothetical protein